MVTINALQSLCGEGMERQPFETIIKLTLLSKKKIVKSSKRITASLSPKVDQTFSFSTKDIDSRAIRLPSSKIVTIKINSTNSNTLFFFFFF